MTWLLEAEHAPDAAAAACCCLLLFCLHFLLGLRTLVSLRESDAGRDKPAFACPRLVEHFELDQPAHARRLTFIDGKVLRYASAGGRSALSGQAEAQAHRSMQTPSPLFSVPSWNPRSTGMHLAWHEATRRLKRSDTMSTSIAACSSRSWLADCEGAPGPKAEDWGWARPEPPKKDMAGGRA
jgi:hypothetical protein